MADRFFEQLHKLSYSTADLGELCEVQMRYNQISVFYQKKIIVKNEEVYEQTTKR